MAVYDPGIYRTGSGKLVLFGGGRWKEFYNDYRGVNSQDTFYEPPATWGKLTKITADANEAAEQDTLNKVKIWWEQAAKREEADWAPLIELASILMGTEKPDGK